MNPEASKLLKKIDRKEARIGVIGLGYVGLPLIKTFLQQRLHGHRLRHRPDGRSTILNRGKSYISHISAAEVKGYPGREEIRGHDRFPSPPRHATPSSSASRRPSTGT